MAKRITKKRNAEPETVEMTPDALAAMMRQVAEQQNRKWDIPVRLDAHEAVAKAILAANPSRRNKAAAEQVLDSLAQIRKAIKNRNPKSAFVYGFDVGVLAMQVDGTREHAMRLAKGPQTRTQRMTAKKQAAQDEMNRRLDDVNAKGKTEIFNDMVREGTWGKRSTLWGYIKDVPAR